MSAASGATSLASAVNIGVFNLGNAIGALLGGSVSVANLGDLAVAFTGAAIAVISFAIAATRAILHRRVKCAQL
ncbi:hypothetical protein A8A01_00200 [Ewingella americana]|nr:hypothetical protein A8A01_00200 [Ewingella americana]